MIRKILIIVGILSTVFQVSAYSKIETRKTSIVEHRAFQSIFKREYKIFDNLLSQIFFDTDCKVKLTLDSIQKEGLFKKGKFVGIFKFNCMGGEIKNINLFFDVYPYNEISISKIEIIKFNSEREIKSICWSHFGDFISCNGLVDENTKYNFQ